MSIRQSSWETLPCVVIDGGRINCRNRDCGKIRYHKGFARVRQARNTAEWRKGISFGSCPQDCAFDPRLRNHIGKYPSGDGADLINQLPQVRFLSCQPTENNMGFLFGIHVRQKLSVFKLTCQVVGTATRLCV